MKSITIEVHKWEKHQIRKDLKSMSWFRVSSDIFFDVKFAQLTPSVKLCWLYLLSECARSATALITVYPPFASKILQSKTVFFLNAISKLEELQLLNVVSRDDNVLYKTDITNKTNKHNKQETFGLSSEPAVADKKPPAAPQEKTHWLLDLWNQHRAKLPQARIPVSPSRLKKIKTRTKEIPEKATWEEAVKRLAASDFCNGNNKQSWVANFDFLLNPNSLDKILEGTYDNRKKIDDKTSHWHSQAQRINEGTL